MNRNAELFDRVAARIESDPDGYDQSTFGEETPCGTKHCIAGHAAAEAGWLPTWDEVRQRHNWMRLQNPATGAILDVEIVAKNALGLNIYEAAALFSSSWTPDLAFTPTGSVPKALREIGRGASILDWRGHPIPQGGDES